jgi:hypothetical protein
VVVECGIDFLVQVLGQSFLAYDDDRFQFEPVALGAKPLDLSTG